MSKLKAALLGALALPILAMTNACSGASAESTTQTADAIDGSKVTLDVSGPRETLRWASGVDAKGQGQSLRVAQSATKVTEQYRDGSTEQRRYVLLRHVYRTNGMNQVEFVAAVAPGAGVAIVYARTITGTTACYYDNSGAPFGRPARNSAWAIPSEGNPKYLGSNVGNASACDAAFTSTLRGHLDVLAYFAPALQPVIARTFEQGILSHGDSKTPGHDEGVAIVAALAGGGAAASVIVPILILGGPVTLSVAAGAAFAALVAETLVITGDMIQHHFDEADKVKSGAGRSSGGTSQNEADPGGDTTGGIDIGALGEFDPSELPSGEGDPMAGDDGPSPGPTDPGGDPGSSSSGCNGNDAFASHGIHVTTWCY